MDKQQLVQTILDSYATGRRADISAVDHVLSHKRVQDALDAFARSPDTARIAALEEENARLREGIAAAIGPASMAIGRLEIIGTCPFDTNIADGLDRAIQSLIATTTLGEQL